MFDKDFYPTPDDVIAEMMYGVDFENKIIYEPSAGSGNIVAWLKNNGAKEVIASEKNDKLRKIVQTMCKVISNDFLDVKSEDISHIDLIVMNPPFSADDKHIIHAFDIAPDGCTIIALCNYDSFKHGYTNSIIRLNRIIRDYGNIINIGDVFKQAERTTGVNIGLIKLHKPNNKRSEFYGFFMDEEPDVSNQDGIMPYNAIRDIVNRYIAAVKLYAQQLELGVQMNTLTNTFFKSKLAFTCTQDGKPQMYEDYKKDLQKNAWKWVFDKMNMDKYVTKGLKNDINKFVERQSEIPFTMKNIYKMIEIVVGTHDSRMDKAIIDVFDRLTMHYHDNRYNVEGWKTNSHYLINEKFILNYIVSNEYGHPTLQYNGSYELIDDMVKAICHITGKNYEKIGSLYYFVSHNIKNKDDEDYDTTRPHANQYRHLEWGKWYDWAFFEIRAYKKGTMHFKFKERDVWALFNQQVARIKGYPLPEAIKI